MTDKNAIHGVMMTPRFLHLNGRRLFTLEFAPATQPARQALLYIPPFAEEMNRCRSHVAGTARALASQGVQVLTLDPWGTGESEGDGSEPGWDDWLDDVEAAFDWLARHSGSTPGLWGLRTGALLAGQLSERLVSAQQTMPARLLLWQPVLDGKLFLNQHIRLRLASQMVHDGDRETSERIRARLDAGEVIEVAGYPLTGRMAAGLASARMPAAQDLARVPVRWLEVVAKPGQDAGQPARKLSESVQALGGDLVMQVVASPFIWQTFDREHAPELRSATLELLGLNAKGAMQ